MPLLISRRPAWADRPERLRPTGTRRLSAWCADGQALQRWGWSLATATLAVVGVTLVLVRPGSVHAETATAAPSSSAGQRLAQDERRGPPPADGRDMGDAREPRGPLPVRLMPGAPLPLMPGLHALGDRRLQQRLQLSVEQSARLQGLADGLRRDLDAIGRTQRTLHQQLEDALLKPPADGAASAATAAAAVDALRARLVAGVDSASQRELQAWRDVQAVLSPAQRQQLAAALREARESRPDEAMPRPVPWREGPGGEPGGRREPEPRG